MKIIFVCTGNTCRSPLAESYAKSKHDNMQFESRGLMVVGREISQHSLNIINEEQLAPSTTPQQLSVGDINHSLLLTMTEQHKMHIKAMFPSANVMTLSEHTVGETKDVSDPYGGSRQAYDEVFNELKHYIDALN